jgi:hypothetical protein
VLCLCAVGALLSFSAAAPGAGDQAQIAVWGKSADGLCSGVLFETLTGVVTSCRPVPPDLVGGVWQVAADGSLVGNGQGEVAGASAAPVTLIRPDGQVVTLDSNPNDYDPSLSSDGSKVVFVRALPQNYQGAWPSDLYVGNTDGSGLKKVASGGATQLDGPTFSPDGSTIAYSCLPTSVSGPGGLPQGCGPLPDGSTRAYATFLMNTDGTDKRVIFLNEDGGQPHLAWSADGKWIATEGIGPCTCTDGSPLEANIYVYRTDGTDLFSPGDPREDTYPNPSHQVSHETDEWGASEPQFIQGSSTQLVYFRPVNDSGQEIDSEIVINLDGTNRHELSLADTGQQFGDIVPAATGGGPLPFVNVMRVPVPTVRSLSYGAAKQRLQGAHLRVGKIHRRYSARTPRNHVLGQYPHGGTYAHRTQLRGPRVNLTLSRGPRK